MNPEQPRVLGPAWQAPPAPSEAPVLELHPNLARVALEYQRVCERFARREIDEVGANREIRNLIARDDEGVAWTVNPRDGGWLYWSRRGEWVGGEPPRSGLASLTAYDLTDHGGRDANPDREIVFTVVSDRGDRLAGSTRRAAEAEVAMRRPRWVYPAIAAVIAAVAAVAALAVLTDDPGERPLLEPSGVPDTP